MSKLTPRQRRFVDEYVVDPNATQAAVRAGYSARSARQTAHRMLTNDDIAAAVEGARDELAERAGVERERIVEEFKRLAFSDLRDSTSWSGKTLKPTDSRDLSPDAARAIQEVTETVTDHEDGSKTVRRRVKLHDKVGPLRDLAKILGMYPKDGTSVNVNVNVGERPKRDLSEMSEEELDFYESWLAREGDAVRDG